MRSKGTIFEPTNGRGREDKKKVVFRLLVAIRHNYQQQQVEMVHINLRKESLLCSSGSGSGNTVYMGCDDYYPRIFSDCCLRRHNSHAALGPFQSA